jgi:hypothetical protein
LTVAYNRGHLVLNWMETDAQKQHSLLCQYEKEGRKTIANLRWSNVDIWVSTSVRQIFDF